MKVFLAIVLLCGVASCEDCSNEVKLAVPTATRSGDPRRSDLVDQNSDLNFDAGFDVEDDLGHEVNNRKDDQSHKFDDFFNRNEEYDPRSVGHLPLYSNIFNKNERLIKVVQSVLDKLVYSVEDERNKTSRVFTKFSYFFYRYLEAKNDHFLIDFTEAIFKFLKVRKEPSYALAGPVRAAFSKFVASISRRVAVVQKVCSSRIRCESALKVEDAKASANCVLYYQNVKLHDAALANVDSAEFVLKVGAYLADEIESPNVEVVLHRLVRTQLINHFKNVKAVYKLVQKYHFPCYYQDDNQLNGVSPKFF